MRTNLLMKRFIFNDGLFFVMICLFEFFFLYILNDQMLFFIILVIIGSFYLFNLCFFRLYCFWWQLNIMRLQLFLLTFRCLINFYFFMLFLRNVLMILGLNIFCRRILLICNLFSSMICLFGCYLFACSFIFYFFDCTIFVFCILFLFYVFRRLNNLFKILL